MHYYQFHIGDYASHTRHLSVIEDCAYRRLLDFYYLNEKPINQRDVARQIGMREHEQDVLTVLNEFFISSPEGFIHPRADREIAKYREFAEAGKRGAAKRWSTPPQLEANGEANSPPNATPIATNNHKPLTINHKPIVEKSQRGSRLANDWVLPNEWEYWSNKERPDLNAMQVADQFKDFWCAKPGKDGVKLDWAATWRNWVRNQKAPKMNPAEIVRVTVAPSNLPDPALEKFKADEKTTRPPTPEERAILNSYRRKA